MGGTCGSCSALIFSRLKPDVFGGATTGGVGSVAGSPAGSAVGGSVWVAGCSPEASELSEGGSFSS